ncbi:MAG TPA: tyrosine-type recombinase/integrase, partial [Alphaproteobacteria bacterium]|nr:tyrosine-type recombinase/integrase [Alphaproteobacteria bacterium]
REKFGDLQVDGISRSFVFALRDSMRHTPRKANLVISVLRRLLNYALNREIIKINPASKPEQIAIKPRYQVWTVECETAFLAKNPQLRLAYLLAAYTAQRQGDILHMTWSQYNGSTIKVRQEKTAAYIEIPCHKELREALDKEVKKSPLILTTKTGRAWKGHHFRHEWNKAMMAAGIENLQFRDLRRTSIVRLAEAGATIPEIAAISGHTIDRCQRILEVYLPRNSAMARAAVEKLERRK